MSVVDAPNAVLERHRERPTITIVREHPWLAAAVVAKAADIVTTVVGLALAGVIEAAPVPTVLFATIGVVPAVAGLGWLALALVVGGDALIRRWYGAGWACWYRRVTCGLLAALWTIVAVGNIGLILGVLT